MECTEKQIQNKKRDGHFGNDSSYVVDDLNPEE